MKTYQIIVCVYFGLLMSFGCAKKEEQKEVLRPVRYQEVLAEGGQRIRIFTGVAQAGIETNLSFKVSGTIQMVNVKIGQKVKAGNRIAFIDPSDYVLQYEDADAAVKNANAQERNAKSNFERVALLYENQNTSLSEFESARTQYESAKANEKSAKKRRKLAKAQLSYCKLFAPVDGVIAEVSIEENENVSVGQTVVLLNSGSDIEVRVSLPGVYISKVKVGDEVNITFSSFKDQIYQGIVTEVAFTTGRAETTYPVSIKIKNPDDRIRPGMAVDVGFTFIYEGNTNKMIVSAFSVGEDPDGRFVFTVNPTTNEVGIGLIERKEVTTGELTNEGIEITSGLKEGDLVVTAGVSKITDGMRVKLLQ